MKVRYRPQRGGLAEAMQEMVTVHNKEELVRILQKDWPEATQSNVTISPYSDQPDTRIGWEKTLIVCVGEYPVGFTDGAL